MPGSRKRINNLYDKTGRRAYGRRKKETVSVQLCNEQIDRVEKEVRVLSQEGEADEQL